MDTACPAVPDGLRTIHKVLPCAASCVCWASPLPALPKPKWLLAVYARDVLGRLHEVKAKITSVLGCVLKMDSTKKVFFSALFISRNLPDTDMCVHNECPYIFHNRSQRNLLVLRQEQLPGAQMWGTNAAKSSSPC